MSKFNSFVTKCVKSYLSKYILSITKNYCSSYNSIKQNIETFKCIQKCIQSMLSNLNGNPRNGNGSPSSNSNGNDPSERYVKFVFSNISNDYNNIKTTIHMIDTNLASDRDDLIDIYYTYLEKFLDSNLIDKTTGALRYVKNYMSRLTENISNYTTRIRSYLISPLTGLTDIEDTISSINNSNGNGIKDKYDEIKHKVRYCKSSLEYEVERLESISKNSRMLENHLGKISGILNKHKTIEAKLKKFKEKLNKMKENKKKYIDHISRTVQMVICNLYEIYIISNCLNSTKDKVSIGTIKKDVENIYSGIKDINNILSVIRSHLIILDPINLGIDCGTVNDVESCIKEIVCYIHKKYCCLSSDISTVFSDTQSSEPNLEGCQLTKITECLCTRQTGPHTCDACQPTQGSAGSESCPSCECLKQLLKTPCSDSKTEVKLKSIEKVVSQLINGKPKDGCNASQQNQQCSHLSHVCQTGQQGQATSTCATIPGEKTNTCQGKTTGKLIESTLVEITKCQQSSKLTDACKDEVKCEDPPGGSCQTIDGAPSTPSCSPATGPGVVSSNELGKVKLCLDTMVNKCNCQKLKESLTDKNIKSFVDVLKWIFIYNFRELLSFYLCFDKSLLDQISCLTEKLQQMKFDLGGMISINNRIDGIKNEINESTKKVEILANTMKSGIKRSVVDMECGIEGVARNFIRCSLLSLRKHVITDSNSRNCNVDRNKNLLENRVVSMY